MLKKPENKSIILKGIGSKNINLLESSIKYLEQWSNMEYMRTRKDSHGIPNIEVRLTRKETFFKKYAILKTKAVEMRLNKLYDNTIQKRQSAFETDFGKKKGTAKKN